MGQSSNVSSDSLACGIICVHWPTWLYALGHSAFDLKWIILLDNNLFDDIILTFPGLPLLCYYRDVFSDVDPVDLLCFNGPMVGLSVPPSLGSLALFDWKFQD
jgi:hypothetical protein